MIRYTHVGAAVAFFVVVCMASSSAAQSEDGEAGRSEPVNTIGAKAALALEFDGDARVGGGANASYERELIPKDLQMELVFGAGVNDKTVKIPTSPQMSPPARRSSGRYFKTSLSASSRLRAQLRLVEALQPVSPPHVNVRSTGKKKGT